MVSNKLVSDYRSSTFSDSLPSFDGKASSRLPMKMLQAARPRSTFYLLYVVFIATFGPLQFGYHLVSTAHQIPPYKVAYPSKGELNAPQRVITCQDQSFFSRPGLPQCIPMSPSQWGLVQSIFTIGGFLGALSAGPIATKHGRLLVMRTTTLVFIIGPLASAFAYNINLMIFGRFLSGIGAGASTVVCPLYVAEVSPPDKRGLFGAFTQVMINMGILLAQLLGYFLSHDNMWRVILASAALIGVLELAGLCFVPESPKWLAENAYPEITQRVSQSIAACMENEADPAGMLFCYFVAYMSLWR